jgi:hypothetical protein
MTDLPARQITPKRGRSRRGTAIARAAALINAATRAFLRERYKNKADLLGALIGRLVDRVSTVLATAELNRLESRAALRLIGETIAGRALDPDAAALFRIVASEAHRFPQLATKMRESNKRGVDSVLGNFLREQLSRGALSLADPERAATLFLQMICAELHESLLFGGEAAVATLDCKSHPDHATDIFLLGAAPRK